MPSYIRTLEEVFGKGNVHLLTLTSDYDHIGISTFVVVASTQKLDMDDFARTVKGKGGEEMTSHAMPQERLQQYLRERYSVILTDDHVPITWSLPSLKTVRLPRDPRPLPTPTTRGDPGQTRIPPQIRRFETFLNLKCGIILWCQKNGVRRKK
jgi:hypothetical protein